MAKEQSRAYKTLAASRARDKLVLFADLQYVKKLHTPSEKDDLCELCAYMKTNGNYDITSDTLASRALGFKPYSTETETAFLSNLLHAIGAAVIDYKYSIEHNVPIKDVIPAINKQLLLYGAF